LPLISGRSSRFPGFLRISKPPHLKIRADVQQVSGSLPVTASARSGHLLPPLAARAQAAHLSPIFRGRPFSGPKQSARDSACGAALPQGVGPGHHPLTDATQASLGRYINNYPAEGSQGALENFFRGQWSASQLEASATKNSILGDPITGWKPVPLSPLREQGVGLGKGGHPGPPLRLHGLEVYATVAPTIQTYPLTIFFSKNSLRRNFVVIH